ncbi:MAG TPA: YihA family ribosome biogenesis GTP-binding protein [Flavobacteriaceae bacterium]|nr:MAG: putative GTP-binding protein EngB [Flavobacteriaceae bacterium]HCQ23856.1 YihA family ribosome biogenesis GTP-binding protein [Flavobacteriaceae bacterium]|tara:strand:- start:924 stop:1532 length:609 start_codon:yes stop_codon:yes gene_type:complete
MQIKSAQFIVSNTEVEKCPSEKRPEFAFIGRSNVGKSSLINALCNQKKLAKTSSRPGKTQLINHFLINEQWYLVDLPGYGYAKVSKVQKKKFQSYIESYFRKRTQLLLTFVLLDIRHPAQPIDLEFIAWLGRHEIPFYLVFTKADKLSSNAIDSNVVAYQKVLKKDWEEIPLCFVTSATKKLGLKSITESIGDLLIDFAAAK